MKKAEHTRRLILQKAFDLIYKNGYQATSVDEIIATTQVTKGAFYYHFRSKDEMGLAIVGEILLPSIRSSDAAYYMEQNDPVESVYLFIEHLLLKHEFMTPECGCPVSNLTQELASHNNDFRAGLADLTGQLTSLMVAALEQGKQAGSVRNDVNTRQVSLMVLSGYWGIRNLGRLEKSQDVYLPYLKELKYYLNTLR